MSRALSVDLARQHARRWCMSTITARQNVHLHDSVARYQASVSHDKLCSPLLCYSPMLSLVLPVWSSSSPN